MTPGQIVLLVSLAANGLLGWAYLGERDDATEARAAVSAKGQELAGVRGAAEACSTAVGELRTLADKRLLEAESARRAAAGRAADHNRKADQILSMPAPVPGDACASAQVRVDAWLQGRARP
ncbi:hypothetical protein QRO08_16580 [Paracidovorax citrulli]|uniref:DUF2514 family protein n=1 Tax=Paracidovorax citrulli TaxID=80869 RepID=A0ABY9AKS8_PARCI|nr:hypothetical protein [Paracidovorax citrulli]ATG94759.1 hypothetical protein CQB05_12580 [Paracidovorax citrulli]MVT38513.1 hypothetical protein [Paracidovorax citrulli]PVY66418.1 hypothetical protein C8E08_3825 [Paracidovorax citrulli]REG69412.1 hypothetical protein C8E07_2562 [Paracidovorax citrulli]RLJ93966.1 hypothetical protein C8E06_2561 [Paracidovorax citrulli]